MHIFLKNRAFRQLTVNEWISSFGDTIFYLAFINYVSSYAFAPLAIFLISLSETIPQVLQLFTGVIADFQKNRISKYISILFIKVLLYSGVTLLLTSTDFSLFSVFFICSMNLISDTIGFLAGYMLTPIYIHDMTEAMGFRQSTSSIVRLIGNLSGGVFLGLFSISTLAFVNVLTFLFAFLGSLLIRNRLKKEEEKIEVPPYVGMSSFFQHLKESMKLLMTMEDVMVLLWILSISQAVLMMVEPVSAILLIHHPFMGLSTGQSLAILIMISLLHVILGGLLSGFLSKKISIRLNIYWSLLMESLIVIDFLRGSFLLILLGSAGDAFSAGVLSPRLQAMIFGIIPEELMGSVQSSINVINLLIPAVLSLALVFLATSAGLEVVAFALIILLLIAAYLVHQMKNLPNQEEV
ncbi:MFS transporter [Streptococcus pneumoniae]|nr:MFS transporter [Streptococcus pneumoniae]VLW29641.1 MFS transporter [Streptococcus pneumoniae]VNS21568.1 MFS transporter [Streptococcus pneumoniae]VNY14177.1 MFS transporter [Streptococcus pneumoniae]VRF69769.1 MFS transporter [Streptococcus pneumoniae]